LKESVAKLEAKVEMMLQGLIERDKQYGRKYQKPWLGPKETSSKEMS